MIPYQMRKKNPGCISWLKIKLNTEHLWWLTSISKSLDITTLHIRQIAWITDYGHPMKAWIKEIWTENLGQCGRRNMLRLIWFLAMQWRRFPHRASVVLGLNDWILWMPIISAVLFFLLPLTIAPCSLEWPHLNSWA